MRKNQNTEPNIPIEEKHKGFRTWKSGKRWVTIAGITLVTLGTVGAVLAQVGIQAKTSTTSAVKSTYPTPPSDCLLYTSYLLFEVKNYFYALDSKFENT